MRRANFVEHFACHARKSSLPDSQHLAFPRFERAGPPRRAKRSGADIQWPSSVAIGEGREGGIDRGGAAADAPDADEIVARLDRLPTKNRIALPASPRLLLQER